MKIRHNSHYGYSPITYPPCFSLWSWAMKKIRNGQFIAPKWRYFYNKFLELFMKKFFVLMLSAIIILSLSLFCGSCSDTVEPVVIDVTLEDNSRIVTLKEYMDGLCENGKLSYSLSSGMVVEINGKANTTNTYWMLYTNDTENSNKQWGTYEYNKDTYGSAICGASELIVKNGYTYVWVYQKF